jgi:hypothetical protein
MAPDPLMGGPARAIPSIQPPRRPLELKSDYFTLQWLSSFVFKNMICEATAARPSEHRMGDSNSRLLSLAEMQ